MMNISIQSTSDIITNSSTEVYLMLTSNALSILENAITSIIQCTAPEKSFDDFFEIDRICSEETEWRYRDYLIEHSDLCYSLWKSIKNLESIRECASGVKVLREKFENALHENELLSLKDFCDNNSDCIETRFKVTAKSSKFNSAAKNINKINEIENISEVLPMTHALDDFYAELREDVIDESIPREELLANSDLNDGASVVLPKVV